MTFRDTERIILDDGWVFDHIRGSHYYYRHPTKKGLVCIPHHNNPKDIPKGTFNNIMKQAGLK